MQSATRRIMNSAVPSTMSIDMFFGPEPNTGNNDSRLALFTIHRAHTHTRRGGLYVRCSSDESRMLTWTMSQPRYKLDVKDRRTESNGSTFKLVKTCQRVPQDSEGTAMTNDPLDSYSKSVTTIAWTKRRSAHKASVIQIQHPDNNEQHPPLIEFISCFTVDNLRCFCLHATVATCVLVMDGYYSFHPPQIMLFLDDPK